MNVHLKILCGVIVGIGTGCLWSHFCSHGTAGRGVIGLVHDRDCVLNFTRGAHHAKSVGGDGGQDLNLSTRNTKSKTS